MFTFRWDRGKVDSHTLSGVRTGHGNYSVGTTMAEAFVPGVDIWGTRGVMSRGWGGNGRRDGYGKMGKSVETASCHGRPARDNITVHVRDDYFARKELNLISSVLGRIRIREQEDRNKADGGSWDVKGVAKGQFAILARQLDGPDTNGVDGIATEALDGMRYDGTKRKKV